MLRFRTDLNPIFSCSPQVPWSSMAGRSAHKELCFNLGQLCWELPLLHMLSVSIFSEEHFQDYQKSEGVRENYREAHLGCSHLLLNSCMLSFQAIAAAQLTNSFWFRVPFLILHRGLLLLLLILFCFLSFVNISVCCLLTILFATNKSGFVYVAPPIKTTL